MAKGREYAENLVGPLDRSFYETQRQVAKQTNQTNWDNLQNQYKNLTDQLKRKQEQANIDFANGLVGVAEGSLNRMSGANQDMANRGLTSSGLSNLVEQSDTAIKGEQILNLLGAAGDIATATAEQLSSSNTNYANKAAQLNADLAGTLGDINAGDIAAQMDYNQGLANIGEAMESREAENELEAMQRAINAMETGAGAEAESIEEEIYRRRGIVRILADPNLTQTQKTNSLKILYGIENANQVVGGYLDSVDAVQKYNDKVEVAKKSAEKANKKVPQKYVKTKVKGNVLEPEGYKDSPFYNKNSKVGNPYNSKEGYVYKKVPARVTEEQKALDKLLESGITYADLYTLLYSN